MGIYGRTASSSKSRTTASCSAGFEASLEGEESLEPAGAAFSCDLDVGERISSIKVAVGSMSVLDEVRDR